MSPWLRLLRPVPLLTGGLAALVFLAFYLGRQLGLSYIWIAVAVGVLVLIYALALLVIRLHAVQASQRLEKSIQESAERQAKSAKPGREDEIEEVKTRLLEAIGALKSSKVGKGTQGSSALYVLPWYMIIGPPAAGKTTLLQQSGLNYPYMDPTRSRSSVRGVGGTRNCDWWFADEAVILDTAGRYVLPVEADDTAEWLAFLDLLKRHRGRKPLNGLLVGISIADLIGASDEELDNHAHRIRSRIDELIQRLGITFPVYVVFTKCDLIRGFVEFFGDLSKAERAQPLGATIAREHAQRQAAEEIFKAELDRLLGALVGARRERLAQVQAPEARPEVYFFPLQIEAARERLARFLEHLFRKNPYQDAPIFRGFYLTSGTQEGRPIDHVIHALFRGFGVGDTEDRVPVEPSQKKSYFIEQVFSKIAFPDRNLAGPSAAGERRRRAGRVKAFAAGTFILGLFTLALIGLSASNRGLISSVRTLSGDVWSAQAGQNFTLGDLRTMDRLRGQILTSERRGGAGLRAAFLWTYQGDPVEERGANLLLGALHRQALEPAVPMLLGQLGRESAGGFFKTYELYRTWKVLQDPAARLADAESALRAAAVLGDHWHAQFAEGTVEECRTLLHQQLLFAVDHPRARVEMLPPIRSRDAGLEASVLSRMRNQWTVEGLYPALQAAAGPLAEISVAAASGEGLAGGSPVAALYTKAAWTGPIKAFFEDLERVRTDPSLRDAFGYEPPSLQDGLLERYARDYESAWIALMRSALPSGGRGAQETQLFLDRAASPESPIVRLLKTVDENTVFENAPRPMERLAESFGPVHDFVASGNVLRRAFNLVDKEKKPSEEYRNLVNALKERFAELRASSDPGRAKESLELKSWIDKGLPGGDAVSTAMATLLKTPAAIIEGTVRADLGADMQTSWRQVHREFQGTLANRYPFSTDAEDASLEDFVAFFGPDGTFWRYYK
ncbi:MAG: type VI secretion system membrane subunit TssM, partial [Candidatus Eisenbacteria bacterium]